jgi:sporulation protein YlmC with PRC-barrel domain
LDTRPPLVSSVDPNAISFAQWYKQAVYDPSNNKIGEIMDLLLNQEGKASVFVIAVYATPGEEVKNVVVPFQAIKGVKQDHGFYYVVSATKDSLRSAKSFKYDLSNMKWIPDPTR